MLGGDVADAPVTWLAIRDDQKAFEDQQLRALRAAFPDLAEASPAQLGIFFHYCKASGLDPFGRQIYMIRRRSRGEVRWTIQTGIDGYRLIARRAADRAGEAITYEDFVWYDADGVEHAVWLRDEPPMACKVVVWRGDSRFPAVAHWREYAPKVWDYETKEYKLGGLWPQMPASQLGKVAEALALRRACPADLSGLHVEEEMHAADAVESRERVQAAAARVKSGKTSAASGGAATAQPAGKDPADASTSGETILDAVVVAESASEEGPDTSDEADGPDGQEPEAQHAPADPRAALGQARGELQQLAGALGLNFDAVNERCFEQFGVSYQDADTAQLRSLAEALEDEPEGGSEGVTSQSERPADAPGGRRRTTAKKTTAAKKAAPKKTAARRTAATTTGTRARKRPGNSSAQ
jgi:phage recombination protein Bet